MHIRTIDEDKLERLIERRIDKLDRAFLRGEMDQRAYDLAFRAIDQMATIAHEQEG
jgi:hypothetical protein